MKLHFEPDLDYQKAAIEALPTCFAARRSTAPNSRSPAVR